MSYSSDEYGIGSSCTPYIPTTLEKFYYNGVLLFASFIFSRFVFHEGGHFLLNVLMGGELPSDLEVTWFFFIPMVSAPFQDKLVVLLGGPLIAILAGWYFAYKNRFTALTGPCGGRNVWKKRRGIVAGLLLQSFWDAIYLVPVVDPIPFDGVPGGDGIGAAQIFRDMGLHKTTISGATVIINPQYLIAGAALLGTIYLIYRVAKCSPELCPC